MTWTEVVRTVQGLDALGWALVLALWHTTLLAMGVWALFRTRFAALPLRRHNLALAALTMALLLTGATWWGLKYGPRLPEAAARAAMGTIRTDRVSSASPDIPAAQPPSSPGSARGTVLPAALEGTRTIIPWLAAVWCLVVALIGLRLAGSFLLVSWIVKRARTLESGPLVDATRNMAGRVGLRRPVAVAESSDLSVPATTGWVRPTMLVPRDLDGSLPADQIDPVIAHELEHVRLGDRWLAIVQAAAETAMFFAPGTRWLARRAREAREQQCDDTAIRVCGSREAYAKALGMLATRATGVWWAAALGQQAPSLVDRVRRVLKGESMPVISRAQAFGLSVAALTTVASGALVFALSLNQVRPAQDTAGETAVASGAPTSGRQARVPTGFARTQLGSPVSVIQATGDGMFAFTHVRLRNVSERRLESVTFLAVVEHAAEAEPAILVPSDPLSIALEPGEAGDVGFALLPISDVLGWKQSQGYRAQVFLGLLRATFADGDAWAITPSQGAMTHEAVFHFESRPWKVSRAMLAEPDQPVRPGATCYDERGGEYSPGAVVRIREGGTAQCIDGRWIEQAPAPSDMGPRIRVGFIQGDSVRAELKVRSAPYTEGGWISVPAQPLSTSTNLTAARFILRAWIEGNGVRVVVTAAGPGGADGTERHVGSFLLSSGESRELVETERFGAAHVVITAREEPANR